jgi:predicted Zn-ribbon and HTH transcriptional regulator
MTNEERNERRRIAYAAKKERMTAEQRAEQTRVRARQTTVYRAGVRALREQEADTARALTLAGDVRELAGLPRDEFAEFRQTLVAPSARGSMREATGVVPNARTNSITPYAERMANVAEQNRAREERRTVDDVLRDRATAILAEQAELRKAREVASVAHVKLLPTFISNELIETAKSAGKQWECIICATEKCPSTYKFRACGHRQCGDCFAKCGTKCPECRS